MGLQHMAYSDQLIIPAIQRLAAMREPLTTLAIAAESGVALSTVQRRIYKLEKAGVIRRTRGRRWGGYYEIVEP